MRQLVRATAIPAGDTPPTEFRIFRAGLNPMTKGTFNFTAASAERIMAEYAARGVDMVIDLEHESVSGQAIRADSRDARGWFKLEVRAGELWAVDVRWTPDGERRLAEKTQRYISPVFGVDTKSKEIVDLVNCALVADPATHDAPALVAAAAMAADPGVKEPHDPEAAAATIQTGLRMLSGHDVRVVVNMPAAAASVAASARERVALTEEDKRVCRAALDLLTRKTRARL